MDKPKAEIIYVHETFLESLARDAVTFVTLTACIGVGVYLDSTALQWIGGVMAIVMILSRGNLRIKRGTPQECANWLREKWGVSAADEVEGARD